MRARYAHANHSVPAGAYHLNIIYSGDRSQIDIHVYCGGAICRKKEAFLLHVYLFTHDLRGFFEEKTEPNLDLYSL